MREIKTAEEHENAMNRILQLWDFKGAQPDGEELDTLLSLVMTYEDRHIVTTRKTGNVIHLLYKTPFISRVSE